MIERTSHGRRLPSEEQYRMRGSLRDGTYLDVRILSHHEPVFLEGLGEAPLHGFVAQYVGLGLHAADALRLGPRHLLRLALSVRRAAGTGAARGDAAAAAAGAGAA